MRHQADRVPCNNVVIVAHRPIGHTGLRAQATRRGDDCHNTTQVESCPCAVSKSSCSEVVRVNCGHQDHVRVQVGVRVRGCAREVQAAQEAGDFSGWLLGRSETPCVCETHANDLCAAMNEALRDLGEKSV